MEKTKNIYLSKKPNFNKFNKESRIFYFDYLRIICCFSIILIHVSAPYYKLGIKSYKWKIAYLYNGFARFSVPNFFMISGAVFLNRDLSLEKIYYKYIKRIYLHLLIWSIIYSLIHLNLSKINIKKIIFKIIKGHYHLWYLFATIGLYITVPFSREIVKNEKMLKYILIVYFFAIIIIPNIIYILSYYSRNIYELLDYINSVVNLNTLSVYNFYFIFGHYLNIKNEIKKYHRIIIYIFGLIGFFFSTIISYNIALLIKKKISHYNSKYLNNFFVSISLFLFFKNNFNNLKINKKKNNIIEKISKFTFGIYLIHPLIIDILKRKLNIFNLQINIIFLIPMINIIVFLLSLAIIIILNFIPVIRNYLI